MAKYYDWQKTLSYQTGSGTLTAEEVRMYLKAMALDLQSPNPFKSLDEKQATVEKYTHEIAELGRGTCDYPDYCPLLEVTDPNDD